MELLIVLIIAFVTSTIITYILLTITDIRTEQVHQTQLIKLILEYGHNIKQADQEDTH